MRGGKLACLVGGILLIVPMIAPGIIFSGEGPAPWRQTATPGQNDKGGRTEDWIGLGPEKLWRVRMGFDFKTTYDSNVNREPPGNQDADVIFNFTPSIHLGRQGAHLGVDGSYLLSYEQYVVDTGQSSFGHEFKTRLRLTGEKLTARFDESFKLTKAYATSEQSERRTILFNNINPEIIYQLAPRFSASALYGNYLFAYTDSPLQKNSYVTHEYGGRIYYHATHKFDVYVQGSVDFVDYYRSGSFDSRSFGIYVGSFGKLTERILLNTQTGVLARSYDDSRINPYRNWVWEGVLSYRLTERLRVILEGKRDVQESVYQDTAWYGPNMVGLRLHYRATPHIAIEGSGNFQSNRYPRETAEKTTTKKRKDHLILASLKFIWTPIRRLVFTVGYYLRQRISNFDDFDYIDHSVDVSIGYHF